MKVHLRVAALSISQLFLVVGSTPQTRPAPASEPESGCPLAGRSVTGLPYSGVREDTRSQTLADGTHIERKGPMLQIYRDSQGRTREEFYSLIRPPAAQDKLLLSVVITDPVECAVYDLDVTDRVAERRTFSSPRTETAQADAESNRAAQKARAIPGDLRAKISQEQLGADTMEGLAVVGTKATTTVPTGVQGNDRPMAVITEYWTSTELKVPILVKTSDPRSGEKVIRLTNITRAEPDPELFRVPADYKIREQFD